MPSSVDDRVLDFYGELFEHIFSEPFRTHISERRRFNEVNRQVEAAADAASSSLSRFFLNQKLSEETVAGILEGFAAMSNLLQLENISNPNITTEEVVESLLNRLPCPQVVQQTHDAVYRLALYTVVQVLMQVGPVMAEWQKLNFSSTFELVRRVVNRLNEISDQINAQGQSGQAGADENYELLHRDYLLQRFHRVEAGTVRMTTNLDVDLRELFVMPRVVVRKLSQTTESVEENTSVSLMELAVARKQYGDRDARYEEVQPEVSEDSKKADQLAATALEQVKRSSRTVIVGLPGAGKSTFFEWLQVKLASVEEQFILEDQQAIPLLLRVRQLDLRNLPKGAALIEKATASKDRADLMPKGWLDRQMKAGRVLFMLDGLDEAEPELLNKYLIPWLFDLLQQYPKCHYLISSRPVGYSPGLLIKQKFVECDLLDFNESQVQEYACHWCTAVRLARNESESEARREGENDGKNIVNGFRDHPYIRNLARNPLMLSAICLVNYFEGGRLPEDRALLYQLCVEGLLHNWDQRRGIRSEFGFDEKLRVCREVALAMQAEDRAECNADQVQEIFTQVLDNPERAAKLLEHIRYRTGLLLERRPNVFGFAHLTFQEYLAARAIHEGNRLGVDVNQLVQEHDDGRWKEVIALYCGLATKPVVRDLVEQLIAQSDTESLSEVLTEAYFAAGSELAQDRELRRRLLERVAKLPESDFPQKGATELLKRFSENEVAPIANAVIGFTESRYSFSRACSWLSEHPKMLEIQTLRERLLSGRDLTLIQVSELVFLLAQSAPDEEFFKIIKSLNLQSFVEFRLLRTPRYGFKTSNCFDCSLVEIAFIGLSGYHSWKNLISLEVEAILRLVMQILPNLKFVNFVTLASFEEVLRKHLPQVSNSWSISKKQEFALLSRQLASDLKLGKVVCSEHHRDNVVNALNDWADLLEGVKPSEKQSRQPASANSRSNRTKPKRR
ncbi:MAG: hypothetical protein C6Y22_05760 [Hapalosiphonaceae cyanobacterium JJU2]|nr:MAG: hypothetical protein C6Y22_05760 [Hapalosiphonaceae cyanobacterium JJU2]